jgi:hypothetical protein
MAQTLMQRFAPKAVALHLTPSADGTELNPVVSIVLELADKTKLGAATDEVLAALHFDVVIDGTPVPFASGIGGGTGHEGGYPDGFKASARVAQVDPQKAVLAGQFTVRVDQEPLATFDFVRLKTPTGDCPAMAWDATGFGLIVVTQESCGEIPPYVTAVSLSSPPEDADRGHRLLGGAFCVDVPVNVQYRPTIVQLPITNTLVLAHNESLVVYTFTPSRSVVAGVRCAPQGGAHHVSILTRTMRSTTYAVAVAPTP